MYNGAMVPRVNSQKQEIRPYLTEYINNGHTFASMMLEYTSSDFAIGQFALQALNKKNDAKLFIDRSLNLIKSPFFNLTKVFLELILSKIFKSVKLPSKLF